MAARLLVGADDVRWDAVALGALGAPFAEGVEEREVGVQDLCPPRGIPALGLIRERGLLDRWPKAISNQDCQVRHSVSDKEMIPDRKDFLGSQQFLERRVVKGLEHRVKTQRQHARQHVALTHNHPPARGEAPGRAGDSPLGSGAAAPAVAAFRPPLEVRRCIALEGKRAKRYSPILSRRKPRSSLRKPGGPWWRYDARQYQAR